jgi:hypothetical protein
MHILPVNAKTQSSFLDNIHSLRALVIFLIVSGHTLGHFPWQQDNPLPWLLDILENASVMFVFIAGFLFQYLSKRYHYREYLQKKISHVILPYLFISIPAVIEATIDQHAIALYPELAGHAWAYQVMWFYLEGGAHINFALWFIPMIALFYLAAPVFMQFIKKPQLYWIILPLVVLSLLIKRAAYPNLDIVHLAIYMLPAYLLGMWHSQFGDRVLRSLENRWLLNVVLIVLCWLMPLVMDAHSGNYEEPGYFTFQAGWIDWLFVQKLLLAVLLTVAFKHLPAKIHRGLAPLAHSSFAIFFVHVYWLFILEHLLARYPLKATLVSWLVIALSVLALSHLLAVAVKKCLPRHSRYLIGY